MEWRREYYMGKSVPSPESGLWWVFCVKVPVACSNTQGCSECELTPTWLVFGCRFKLEPLVLLPSLFPASLTPGPSFAHNLGCKCPNDQCEGILDIYISRPFQWHQEHPNARCFGLCYRALNIRESRRTPNPQLWEWEFHPPTSPKVGLRHTHYAHKATKWFGLNIVTTLHLYKLQHFQHLWSLYRLCAHM